MYGISTYIWAIFGVNVVKYSSTIEHLGMEKIIPFQVVQLSNVQNSCCFMISSGVKKRSNILGLSIRNGKSYQQTTTKEGHRGLNRLVKGRDGRLSGLFAMLIRIYTT